MYRTGSGNVSITKAREEEKDEKDLKEMIRIFSHDPKAICV